MGADILGVRVEVQIISKADIVLGFPPFFAKN